MDRYFGPKLFVGDLTNAIRDHFVYVLVRLGARSGLPDVERELVIELSGDDLVGNLLNQVGLFFLQATQSLICDRCSFLDVAIGMIDLLGHEIVPNRKVIKRALSLCAPETLCGNRHLSEGIGLDAKSVLLEGSSWSWLLNLCVTRL